MVYKKSYMIDQDRRDKVKNLLYLAVSHNIEEASKELGNPILYSL